jgi:hypothetical protein
MIEDIFSATNRAITALSPDFRYTLSAAKNADGLIINEVDWDSLIPSPNNTAPIPTKEAIIAKRQEIAAGAPMRRLRAVRDQKLAETDWVVTKALERGETVPADWVTYRQILRDITSNYSSLEDVVWPTKP